MKPRRRLFLVLVLLLLVSGLFLVPQVRWPIYGWLRGEAFYQGMPTSYWHSEISRLNQQPSWTHRLLDLLGATGSDIDFVVDVPMVRSDGTIIYGTGFLFVPSSLFTNDSAVFPVLIALLQAEDSDTQVIASRVLERLGFNARAAVPALKEAALSSEGRGRDAALLALWEIDPEQAQKTGVKLPGQQ